MTIVITNSSSHGLKTFIRAPSNANLKVDNCIAVNGGKFLDIFEPTNHLAFGLPDGVTKEDLQEIFASLKANPNQSQEELEATVKASPLSKWLTTGQQIAKFSSQVIAVIKAGYELVF
ncbi:hypothetical protein [Pseudomonas sp. ICMP 10191]|uniref:hypothetical protein n=1 Tax=Pseudomonas sp. ICMP 10191 TaxID=1198294 RepID=UPI0007305CB7|nr:hypothetical protein [Pseudomonas sp. ICMP 10191]KTB97774.1 hypothetical protein AO388_26405 [Pseudomonas sp. ICMP 10191]